MKLALMIPFHTGDIRTDGRDPCSARGGGGDPAQVGAVDVSNYISDILNIYLLDTLFVVAIEYSCILGIILLI